MKYFHWQIQYLPLDICFVIKKKAPLFSTGYITFAFFYFLFCFALFSSVLPFLCFGFSVLFRFYCTLSLVSSFIPNLWSLLKALPALKRHTTSEVYHSIFRASLQLDIKAQEVSSPSSCSEHSQLQGPVWSGKPPIWGNLLPLRTGCSSLIILTGTFSVPTFSSNLPPFQFMTAVAHSPPMSPTKATGSGPLGTGRLRLASEATSSPGWMSPAPSASSPGANAPASAIPWVSTTVSLD